MALCIIVLFIRLGFWQLQRADLKKQLKNAHSTALLNEARSIKPLEIPSEYENIILQGHYENVTIFLDNQHWQHRFGYHVLTPFKTKHGKYILIDRGWIQADPSRQEMPIVSTPLQEQHIIGQVWFPANNPWSIGPQIEVKKQNVYIIEQANPALLKQYIKGNIEPYLLRLDSADPYGFVRIWPEQTLTPTRHYGYALQWFAMALTMIILTIVLYKRGTNAKA